MRHHLPSLPFLPLIFTLMTTTTTLAHPEPSPPSQPSPGNFPIPETYTWTVTNWEAGCARQGCYYLFNITGLATDNGIPSFFGYCTGYKEGSPFEPCHLWDEVDGVPGRVVASGLLDGYPQGSGAHLAVSYMFDRPTETGSRVNFTSISTQTYNQFVAPPQTFTLNVTESRIFRDS